MSKFCFLNYSPILGVSKINLDEFEINLHERDADILYKIQSFFGVGAIYNRPDRSEKNLYIEYLM